MATTIITKYGSGAPTTSDVVRGELAVDTENKRLYTEDSGGSVVELGTNPAADVTFGDNVKAVFGAGSDLQIYHDASDSIINDNGTGSLKLQQGGSTKLEVTSTGIDVTGTVTADGLTVDTDTLVVDSVNNRVGIGTTSPSNLLTISDATTAKLELNRQGAIGNGVIVTTDNLGNEEAALQMYNSEIRLYNNGTQNFTLTSAGSVGIGTSSPSVPLEVNISGTSDVFKLTRDTGTNGELNIDFSGANANFNSEQGGYTFTTSSVSDALVLTSAGNVGIGTTSPDNLMHLHGSPIIRMTTATTGETATDGLIFGSNADGSSFLWTYENEHLYFGTNNTERVRITEAGNVGIGNDSPGVKLEVSNGSDSDLVMMIRGADDTTEYMALGVNGSNGVLTAGASGSESTNMVFRTASSGTEAEAMRIDSSGNLLVGQDAVADTEGLAIRPNATEGACQLLFNRTSRTATSYITDFQNGGSTVGYISYTNTAVNYYTGSDQRLKENIIDAPSASDDIDAIQVRSFDWKDDGSHQKYGMVAQELVTVVPSAVSQPDDPEKPMGVDYSKLVPMMLKEIQSLRARVAQLEGAN